MKKILQNTILLCAYLLASLNIHAATKIYQWKDAEGIQQFTTSPPPLSCKTSSCIKVNKNITKKFKQKKQADLARIEAEIMKQEAIDRERKKRQQDIIKLVPEGTNNAGKTFLSISTVLCVSLNNIREYKNVNQARKYLERDQLCIKVNEETEYTIIEKQDKFSNIRVYLKDGSSQQKWVETNQLIE